jgi:hypothetical protein
MELLFQGRQIFRFLTQCASLENPAHNLSTSRFGETVNETNRFGFGDRPHFMRNVIAQFIRQVVALFHTCL